MFGVAVSFRAGGGDTIASLVRSEKKIKKLVEFAEVISEQNDVALATLQKLAGQLSFTRPAALGRSGRAA